MIIILIRHIKIFSFCPYKIFVDGNLSKINPEVERAKCLRRKSVHSNYLRRFLEMHRYFLVKVNNFVCLQVYHIDKTYWLEVKLKEG